MKTSFILSLFFSLILSAVTFGQVSAPYYEGLALAREGRFDAALAEFDLAIAKLDTQATTEMEARLRYNAGACSFRLGLFDRAVSELRLSVNLSPRYERAYYALGMASSKLGQWEDAKAAFRKALALNPGNGETWFDLAYVYLAVDDQTAAREAFVKAIRYNSTDAATSYNNIGVIDAERGDIAAAKSNFKKAVRLSKGRLAVAMANLAHLDQLRSVGGMTILLGHADRKRF